MSIAQIYAVVLPAIFARHPLLQVSSIFKAIKVLILLQEGDVRIKFTFDDYETPQIDGGSSSSVHFDPAFVELPPITFDPTSSYSDAAVIRGLPPNSTIVTLPNRRLFPSTKGYATYAPPNGKSEGTSKTPNGSPAGVYDTTATPYVPPYSTSSPSIQAEGRNFPWNTNTANNRIKSGNRNNNMKEEASSENTINFVPEVQMVSRDDFVAEVNVQLILSSSAQF